VREPFTALPCPKQPVSTVDQEGCSERALLRSDAKVNALAARLWKALPASGRASFARGERAWLVYRGASCRAESSKYAGGTLQPVAYLGCEVSRNTAHLTDLAGTLDVLAHP
jgi:uncharacterized protein YecT (DUF1311 family)